MQNANFVQNDRAAQVEMVKNIILRENNNSTITGVSLGIVGQDGPPFINHNLASARRMKMSQKQYWLLRKRPNVMHARRNGRLTLFSWTGFAAIKQLQRLF